MSRTSKLTLLGTSLFAVTTVVFVHFQQKFEQDVSVFPPVFCCRKFFLYGHANCRNPMLQIQHGLTYILGQAMHQGVIRDMEQQRIKKERQLDFEMQKVLEEEYKKGQTVRDSVVDLDPPKRAQGRYH